MSSVSNWTEAEVWTRLGSILTTIPHEESRAIVRTWLQERQAVGLKPSTLVIHANALRGFCPHLGGRGIREATRVDVISYVNTARSQRVWRNKRADGTMVESRRDAREGGRACVVVWIPEPVAPVGSPSAMRPGRSRMRRGPRRASARREGETGPIRPRSRRGPANCLRLKRGVMASARSHAQHGTTSRSGSSEPSLSVQG